MKIVIDLTDKDVEFLQDEDVDTLFHCCGQGATGTDQNMELQKRLEFIIKDQITAEIRRRIQIARRNRKCQPINQSIIK